jgi:hypothetical protein
MIPGPRPLATRVALAVTLLACIGGCNRRAQLVPASSDSTRAGVDSFSVYAREASARWESGLNDEASRYTARVLREALEARPNAPWVERVRGVLDSLGMAADVAGGDRATVANLFARSDPDGGSWPFLFWRDQGSVRFQALENSGLHLEAVATHAFAASSRLGDSAQVAVLWGRRVGGGRQPTLMTWVYKRGRWDMLQTLGPDSLGGTGSGEFSSADTGRALAVRTYRPTPYFDECATCPHVYHERAYAWRAMGFIRLDDRAVPSPYGTFAAFIAALVAGDRERAVPFVVDRSLIDFARRYEWQTPAKGRWRVAPSSDEGGAEIVFLRGPSEAYRVRFEPRDGDWVIAGFEATTRTIE